MFVDRAKIYVRAGDGGRGSSSFRREKSMPRGGPDGGDGGKGGSVWLHVNPQITSLKAYSHQKHFMAPNGGYGSSSNKTGAGGEDVVVDVPVGTEIWSEDESVKIADLLIPHEKICISAGGDGGFGNIHYKTSLNRAPRRADVGHVGEGFWITLALKIMAHVGIIGLPNAGKSTLLAAVSRAKAKVGDYAFTTLEPQLGVVTLSDPPMVWADLPGLIEGASEGKGLGHRFLAHAERCCVLLVCIDGRETDPHHTYALLCEELTQYDTLMGKTLMMKPRVVALTKGDLLPPKTRGVWDVPCFAISSVSGSGLDALIQALADTVEDMKLTWSPIVALEGHVRPQSSSAGGALVRDHLDLETTP